MRNRGFTLAELLVVVAILVVLAALVIPSLGAAQDSASVTTTRASMKAIRDAIMGSEHGPGYFGDMKYDSNFGPLPRTMRDLIERPEDTSITPALIAQQFDPNTKKGWRGPYLNTDGSYPDPADTAVAARGFASAYGDKADPSMLDAWLNPIVIQHTPDPQYVRLVSAGFDGIIQTPLSIDNPTQSQRGDDIILFLRRADDQ